MTTDILEQLEHARNDRSVSEDAMRWNPRKRLPATPLDAQLLADAEKRAQKRREKQLLTIRTRAVVQDFTRGISDAMKSLEAAAQGLVEPLTKVREALEVTDQPPRGRSRRYQQQIRQLHRRNR